ncbi:MAG: DUF1360 domain-containing protein [Candidatus Nomurabacteria bacterium]|nr:DUF1360 domain-containing protein [Candidatus Nomurabacteria bacterium]USN88180.1 MAG: DUF1360 domain-containing protein [Candidatus Nomurabacteria bacterium]
MIRITDQYFWNFVFSIFFLALVVMGIIILQTESRFLEEELKPIDYVLMTLATWRLIRLFAYDIIMRFFREQFWDLKKVGRGFELVKPTTGPRRTLADLLGCPACLGIWMGATVVFFYLLTSYAVIPVVILAVSAVATFLQNVGTLVGNSAEYLDKKNKE